MIRLKIKEAKNGSGLRMVLMISVQDNYNFNLAEQFCVLDAGEKDLEGMGELKIIC